MELTATKGSATKKKKPTPPAAKPTIPPPSRPKASNVNRELVPERIPYISTQDQQVVRQRYLTAPNYKSIATSLFTVSFVSGQPDQETADRMAMEACLRINRSTDPKRASLSNFRICDLYASGTAVVTHRSDPELPSKPWINSSVARAFDPAAIPMLKLKSPPATYLESPRSKAVVLSPDGIWYSINQQSSQEDAMRRSLERCGYRHSAPCLVLAVDDTFVVPIPTLATAIGFFGPSFFWAHEKMNAKVSGACWLMQQKDGAL